jgi:malonyl-CoA decarboxylase
MSETIAPEAVAGPGLFGRALRRVTTVWRDMAASVSNDEDDDIAAQMRACLFGRGGEVSARNRAAKLAETYLRLDEAARLDFLRTLATFDSDPEPVARAYDAVRAAEDPATRAAANADLRRLLEPPRMRLLTQVSSIPNGVKFLVDMRAFLRAAMGDDALLRALEADLRALLTSWFDVGFLELTQVDWSSPAALLEKLAGYEAVHHVRSWRDMKNRLDSDRRCYGFFHPRMPGEPLIFVEVALVRGLAGNVLIKRVVDLLSAEFRNLKAFATLSPIPGFRKWLDAALADPDPKLLSDEEAAALRAAEPAETGAAALSAILARRGWLRDAVRAKAAEPVLTRLCARYLMHEAAGRRALDPVANFHLSNGARVERLNWAGDASDKGLRESASLMVNYVYDPAKIDDYHEDYAGEGKRNASTAVRKLARGWG